MDKHPRIRDLISVPPVQTVIRLAEGKTESEAIAKSFVFTDDVASHFAVFSDALQKDHGRGYFLQGDFGSGKSHFLATLLAWLSDYPGSQFLSEQHGGLKRVKASGRRFLAVDVSLVNYRATRALERIIVDAVETALKRHDEHAPLSPLSIFLTHFKTILEDENLACEFAKEADISVSSSNESDDGSEILKQIKIFFEMYPRQAYTKGIRFMKKIGMSAPETLVEDRHETFERVLSVVADAGFDGLVILIDELSEFFRSKPDARTLNEDARTLQLLGEMTGSHRIWIIAAVQESVERTGDISQVTFRKIKDRFPIKFNLSTLHIKSLISKRLIVKKTVADKELTDIYHYMTKHFPSFKWKYDDFFECYPVHPLTIELLDGLGDLFSVHRGIVDFVHCRIAGDESRQITGILDRPAFELLGPDSIYEHFSSRMAEFSSFHVFPRHVVPHMDDVIEQEIEEPEDQILARRIIRILVLYNIHPTFDIPNVKLIAELVSCALFEHDPNINMEFISEAILDILVDKSRFLIKQASKTGDPSDIIYKIITQDDPTKTLKARILKLASEIPDDDTRLLLVPFSELPESLSWPGSGLLHSGITRYITWRQSSRKAFISFLTQSFSDDFSKDLESGSIENDIVDGLVAGNLDFSLVISLGKTDLVLDHTAVWEIPGPHGQKELNILKEYFAVKQIASGLRPSNPADAPLIQAAKETADRLAPAAYETVLNIFYSGNFVNRTLRIEPVIRQLKRFEKLLEVAGSNLLEKRYPGFKEIAPLKVMPSIRLYQRLLDEFISPGSITLKEARSQGLTDAIEGLATPLGLVELRAGSYVFAPDPEKHSLLSILFGLIHSAGETKLSYVLHTLKTGKYGLAEEMGYFLISALTFGGLVSLLKNGRAIPLDFLQYTTVKDADGLAPGEVIGKHDRETLLEECIFLSPSEGWASFGLRQQREAWQGVIKFQKWSKDINSDIEKRLSAIADFSAFEAFDLQSLRALLSSLNAIINEIKISYTARDGLERFLKAWRGYGLTSEDIEYLKRMRRFLINQAEQFVFINHYIRHTAVAQACEIDKKINELGKKVKTLLDQPDKLVMNDNIQILSNAFEQFRDLYSTFYEKKHKKHYKQFEKKPLSRFAKRAYKLLKRLASIEILDRPAGLHSVLKGIEAPNESICKRNLFEELLRAPVCNCGFILGETDSSWKTEDPEKAIEKCLDDYLTVLRNPEVREAISARVFAMDDSKPDVSNRLRSLNTLLAAEHASSAGLLDLFDDTTAQEMSKALTGKITIKKRSLNDLSSELSGRRLAPDRIYETVRKWIDASEKNMVIAIEDDGPVSSGGFPQTLTWWSRLHPDIFSVENLSDFRITEAELEKHFPSDSIRKRLTRLDDKSLFDFIKNEPFHTNAVREAMIIFTERILSGNSWLPEDSLDGIQSHHLDPDVKGGIIRRLNRLQHIAGFLKKNMPEKLSVRIPLSELIMDTWSTAQLRDSLFDKISEIETNGKDWLSILPVVRPISLTDNPMVIIIDGVSPDVWLCVCESHIFKGKKLETTWMKLDAPPYTATSVSALFGFSQDALQEFGEKDIPYHQVKGDEKHSLDKLLPVFPKNKPVIIHVSLVDSGAHSTRLRLSDMPEAIENFLEREMPGLFAISEQENRSLVITTDHGFTLSKKGLSHGSGGVFETAIFRLEKPDMKKLTGNDEFGSSL